MPVLASLPVRLVVWDVYSPLVADSFAGLPGVSVVPSGVSSVAAEATSNTSCNPSRLTSGTNCKV